MIIVSQDKEEIINFDNMTRVYITFDEDDDYVCIRTETVDSLYEDLGYYKTEARAKEVLQEIINKYKEYATIQNRVGSISDVKILPKVYEMPKEWGGLYGG